MICALVISSEGDKTHKECKRGGKKRLNRVCSIKANEVREADPRDQAPSYPHLSQKYIYFFFGYVHVN